MTTTECTKLCDYEVTGRHSTLCEVTHPNPHAAEIALLTSKFAELLIRRNGSYVTNFSPSALARFAVQELKDFLDNG